MLGLVGACPHLSPLPQVDTSTLMSFTAEGEDDEVVSSSLECKFISSCWRGHLQLRMWAVWRPCHCVMERELCSLQRPAPHAACSNLKTSLIISPGCCDRSGRIKRAGGLGLPPLLAARKIQLAVQKLRIAMICLQHTRVQINQYCVSSGVQRALASCFSFWSLFFAARMLSFSLHM